MRKPTKALIAVLLLAVCLPAPVCRAQELDVSGYLKSLLTAGRTLFDEGFYLLTGRLRTQVTYYPVPSLELRAAVDNQARIGSYLDTLQHSLARPFEDLAYIDLALDPVESDDLHWRAGVHRLYMRVTGAKADLTVGRQRIAWGTGRIWNPTDLFNPNSPLSTEPAEKRGADAVHLALRPGDNLQLELAWAIGADDRDIRWGARARTSVESYDISFMGGRFRDSEIVGLDFTGYVGDAGLRGEFTHTWDEDRSYLRGVLSLEYTFGNGLNCLLEYLYNGGNIGSFSMDAIDDFARYDAITTLNPHFAALMLGKEFHTLISGQLLSIVDVEAGGVFLFPFVTYSWMQDVDVVLGCQLFFADSGDFSLGSHAALASIQWYF